MTDSSESCTVATISIPPSLSLMKGHRCLIPTRQDWFRAMICHLMLVSVSLFLAFGVIQTFVLYDQVGFIEDLSVKRIHDQR